MNISFIVNNLGNSELAFDLISCVNSNSQNSNVILYQNLIPPVVEPHCLTTNIASLPSISGTAVVFDLECAHVLEQAKTQTRNILYLYELEWLYKPVDYLFARALMSNFEVCTVNHKYAEIITNYLDKKVNVYSSLEKLYECLTIQ